jgi:selenocysteine-specific elongation factor
MPREELKSRLKLSTRGFNASINKLIADGLLIDRTAFIVKPEHVVRFDNSQQAKVQTLMRRFEQSPYSPPSLKECQAEAGEEILNALIELGQLIPVSSDVIFRKQDYDLMVETIKNEAQQKERITLAEVRDLFGTSRKYAQALVEHLDAIGITMREGDFRKLRQKS